MGNLKIFSRKNPSKISLFGGENIIPNMLSATKINSRERAVLQKHSLTVLRNMEDPHSMMKALSFCVYFSETFYSFLQSASLDFFRTHSEFNNYRTKNKLEFFMVPSLSEFEIINLKILSLFLHRVVKVYFFHDGFLHSDSYNDMESKKVRLYRDSSGTYHPLFGPKQAETMVYCQNLVLNLVERVAENITGPLELKDLNQSSFLNFAHAEPIESAVQVAKNKLKELAIKYQSDGENFKYDLKPQKPNPYELYDKYVTVFKPEKLEPIVESSSSEDDLFLNLKKTFKQKSVEKKEPESNLLQELYEPGVKNSYKVPLLNRLKTMTSHQTEAKPASRPSRLLESLRSPAVFTMEDVFSSKESLYSPKVSECGNNANSHSTTQNHPRLNPRAQPHEPTKPTPLNNFKPTSTNASLQLATPPRQNLLNQLAGQDSQEARQARSSAETPIVQPFDFSARVFEGRLKLFDEEKGYGFILVETDEFRNMEVFVHRTQLEKAGFNTGILRRLKSGETFRVQMNITNYQSKKYGETKMKAVNVRRIH